MTETELQRLQAEWKANEIELRRLADQPINVVDSGAIDAILHRRQIELGYLSDEENSKHVNAPDDLTDPPQFSLGLSALFTFYKKHRVPIAALEQFENQFARSGAHQDKQLWRVKLWKSEEEIRYFNEALLDWLWHFRDFFWNYASQHLGMTVPSAQALTRATVAKSESLKICGYFTNLRKHQVVSNFKEYPAFEKMPPRLGAVFFHFLQPNGDTVYSSDFVGAQQTLASTRFPYIQTVQIENCHIPRDSRRVADEASWDWIQLLKDHGVDLGVRRPAYFECDPAPIEFIQFGTPRQMEVIIPGFCFPLISEVELHQPRRTILWLVDYIDGDWEVCCSDSLSFFTSKFF